MACLEDGKLAVEGIELDADTELISKLSFSKEGENWEATPSADGACVVALDCTQDEAIISAGMSRELIMNIQQLRKAAGLALQDVVEVFFQEEEGVSICEDAIARNISLFDVKFKGAIPLPKRLAPSWSVVLKSETAEVGGSKVEISVCRPALAVRDSLDEAAKKVLSTLEPSELTSVGFYHCVVDSKAFDLKEGADYWLSTAAKTKDCKTLNWL